MDENVEEFDEFDDFDELDDLDDLPDPELLEESEVAKDVLDELFGKMDIDVDVSSKLSEKDDLDKQIVEVSIEGTDSEDLIGEDGEVMSALQYVGRLMVSHRLQRRVDFTIDVDGHRHKKEAGLSKLAERMASKVIKRQKPVTLEPMNSYERRLVHMALRDHDDVYTKSVGEGRERRVRIYPQK